MRSVVLDGGSRASAGGLGGGDLNLFGYAGNDPINGADPSGLQEVPGADVNGAAEAGSIAGLSAIARLPGQPDRELRARPVWNWNRLQRWRERCGGHRPWTRAPLGNRQPQHCRGAGPHRAGTG